MKTLATLKRLNMPPPRLARALWQHFSKTYLSIRLGLAALAFAFPILLWTWGRFIHGLPLQPSMSSYFWAASAEHCASFPMRTVFVGMLIAIGACLYLYKGLTEIENLLLNGAAICATVVAVVPERLGLIDPYPRVAQLFEQCPAVKKWAVEQQTNLPYHYLAAVALFVLLFVVAWSCAYKSLIYLPAHSPLNKLQFRSVYRGIALLMPIIGAIGGGAVYLLRDEETPAVFFLEMAEIWVFAAYWGVKSFEMSLTKLEKDPEGAASNACMTDPVEEIRQLKQDDAEVS
jgi:hypothetical protein